MAHWKPFEDLESFFEETGVGLDLSADIYEDNDTLVVEMQVPGINPGKIDISVEGRLLHVAGIREEEREVENRNYFSKEIIRGLFERDIILPVDVIGGEARAIISDGVLTIALPKKKVQEVIKAEKIKVERQKK